VKAALTLFRRRGYAGTGLNDIVAQSGAPKGSVYHYFPAGKRSIAEAAVRQAALNVAQTLNGLAVEHPSPGKMVRAYATLLAGWMAKSRFRDGGPITTTVLETAPGDAKVTAAARDAFRIWREPIASRLVEQGVAPARAERLAALVIAAVEGSLIQARVEGNGAVIEGTARELELLLDGVTAGAKR
jgi:TetR/AcrR family transcriptional repressor of lmrAB and yxaGH operons